jgi:DNA gyrase subunit A
MVARALGEEGFSQFKSEQGEKTEYNLSQNQTEAIVSMQLGSLANLEREKLTEEHKSLLEDIKGYLHLLSDEAHILAVVREDMEELQKKFPDKRRTEIIEEELTDVNKDELITEEKMVVTLTQKGYIKRTQLITYQAQNRGGKGIVGAKSDEEDPIEHIFVSSTHSYLLFFTTHGRVHWQKVYDLPLQNRTAKGRAIINLLTLNEGEQVANCVAVDAFDDQRSLIMCTRKGIIKKTKLSAYGRVTKGGIIGIKLDEDDQLIDVLLVCPGEDVVLATSTGMSIRFSERNTRNMGRNTRGVKGISLGKNDYVVGMVIAYAEMTLLTVCERGYGKRTPFGYIEPEPEAVEEVLGDDATLEEVIVDEPVAVDPAATDAVVEEEADEDSPRSGMMYRRQRRGGKGLRDIKTSARNGKVVDIIGVMEDDEVIMVSTGGKIQRLRASDINVVGRNTQGVRVMRLSEGDNLSSIARIPADFVDESELSTPPELDEKVEE